MNNIDDFLNSLGIPSQEEEPPSPPELSTSLATNPNEVESGSENPSEPTTLSDSDFDEILQEIGFEEVQDADAEEIEDDYEEDEDTEEEGVQAFENSPYLERAMNAVVNEMHTENRDLDAEEDMDWENVIAHNPPPRENAVHLHTFDDGPVIAPIQQEADHSGELFPHQIRPNSPTLLIDDSTSRFSGTEWYNEIQKSRIILAGVGGIGSNVAFQIARMHPAALVMYDDDTVELSNMSGQLYSNLDVGHTKVSAIINMLNKYTNIQNIYGIAERFTEETEAGDIMICGFDNMEARKTFYLKWQEHVGQKPEEERKNCLYIDGRLSIDTLQVFCITGDDIYSMERYCQNYLFSDSEADETVCSMKQTTYLACMIGSFIVNLFTNFTANLLNPVIPYDLPFFTEHDARNMIFKTEN